MHQNLAVVAGFAFVFSVVAGRVARSSSLGILVMQVDAIELRVIADLTLPPGSRQPT